MSELGAAAPDVYHAYCPRCGQEMEMRRFRDTGESLDAMITGFTFDWWCRTCRDRYTNIMQSLLEEKNPLDLLAGGDQY